MVAGKEQNMLWTIFVILLLLWLIAVFSGHILGGFVHVLLVIAIVVMMVKATKGSKPVQPFSLSKFPKIRRLSA